MASESKKRKIMPRFKKGIALDGGKVKKGKGLVKFSSSQRRKEEVSWKREIGDGN